MCNSVRRNLPSTRTPNRDEEFVAVLTRSLSKGMLGYRSLSLEKRNCGLAAPSTGGWVRFIAFWESLDSLRFFALQPRAVHNQALPVFRIY